MQSTILSGPHFTNRGFSDEGSGESCRRLPSRCFVLAAPALGERLPQRRRSASPGAARPPWPLGATRRLSARRFARQIFSCALEHRRRALRRTRAASPERGAREQRRVGHLDSRRRHCRCFVSSQCRQIFCPRVEHEALHHLTGSRHSRPCVSLSHHGRGRSAHRLARRAPRRAGARRPGRPQSLESQIPL